jgi:hypothetical protein
MKEHLHKCRECDIVFGCIGEDSDSLFGTCPSCASSGMSVAGGLIILAGVTLWVMVIRALLS